MGLKITFDLQDEDDVDLVNHIIDVWYNPPGERNHERPEEPEEPPAEDVNTTVADANKMLGQLLKKLQEEMGEKDAAIQFLREVFLENGIDDVRSLSTQKEINFVYNYCKEKL